MKQLFSTLTILLISAIVLNSAHAQHKSLSSTHSQFKYDTAVAVNSGTAVDASAVNMKAVKDFSKSFKNVTNEKWYTAEDGFFANFNDNGIETKVAYDKKGIWHCTVRTLSEMQLPYDVRDVVKSKYYDSKILVGYEIKHSNSTVYIVKTEDGKSLKTLRVTDGEMEVITNNIKG
jgi:hypothetical protein